MYTPSLFLLIAASILLPKCYGSGEETSNSLSSGENPILEINVDGTTGFLRGKGLTTIGRNEKPFITFRNIPFALEPERFMVNFLQFITSYIHKIA